MASDASSQTITERMSPKRPSHFELIFSHSVVTQEVLDCKYSGKGTEEEPYSVVFIPHDPRNPMLFSKFRKWFITAILGIATLAVSFNSSAYSGGVQQVIEEFQCTDTVATLGIALFVLGFAIGPLLWGPLSELYGRQILFFVTYGVMTAFNGGAGGAQNVETLLILRFFAGVFGSSVLTNGGGVIADCFPAKERGLAMPLFAVSPFMGPALGPVVGGFVGETIGWRWLEGILAIFAGTVWILACIFVPETYAPVLLRARAAALSKKTGKVYRSKLEIGEGKSRPKLGQQLRTGLSRPWVLLFLEPVVLITSIYMAIIYGTLYMLFAAYPIVYQEGRGWSQGVGGLPFTAVAIGFIAGIGYIVPDNKRYARAEEDANRAGEHFAPPEARLPPSLVGAVLLPVGLFWFAWTNYPSLSWAPSVVAAIPFGAGMVILFMSIFGYLIDAYTVYAASVLAANSVLRSLFGFGFPLFTSYMYDSLGIHWASSIPAFLALACVPAPFLFYKYGSQIRQKQKYSREAAEIILKIKESEHVNDEGSEEEPKIEEDANKEKEDLETGRGSNSSEAHRASGSKNVEAGSSGSDEISEAYYLHRVSLIGADEDFDVEKGFVH